MTDSFCSRLELSRLNKQCQCSSSLELSPGPRILRVIYDRSKQVWEDWLQCRMTLVWSTLPQWSGEDLSSTDLHSQSWAQLTSRGAVRSSIFLSTLSVTYTVVQERSGSDARNGPNASIMSAKKQELPVVLTTESPVPGPAGSRCSVNAC